MRKTAKILNWLVLLVLLGAFVASFPEGKQLSYHVGMAIGLLGMGAPFFLSVRALSKQTSSSAKSALIPNYIVAVFTVFLALYGVVAIHSFAFVPLIILLMAPVILNIWLLKAQACSKALTN